MRRAISIAGLALLCLTSCSVTPAGESAHKAVELGVEETTNLRIGESGVLHLPVNSIYGHATIGGAWEKVLVRSGYSGGETVFRAIGPGQGCIVVTPDVPEGNCISCVTLHYFVEVSAKAAF
jgi:hypothetical protein